MKIPEEIYEQIAFHIYSELEEGIAGPVSLSDEFTFEGETFCFTFEANGQSYLRLDTIPEGERWIMDAIDINDWSFTLNSDCEEVKNDFDINKLVKQIKAQL